MSEMLCLTVLAEAAGQRLDAYLASATELTRSAAVRLIEEGQVTLGGKPANKKDKVKAGDEVMVSLPEPEPDEAIPQDIPLDIVYEDEDILVVNKPCGMVVHPAAGNPDGTLVNAILYHCGDSLSGIGGVIRPGIVHRIDKDTSGLLVVAKNDAAHLALSEQLKVPRVRRVYHAIAIGNLREETGTVDAPIGRHPTDRKKMAVLRGEDAHARDAVTHYRVLERFAGMCHVECKLETGRTHQIRVQFSSRGMPLVGERKYAVLEDPCEIALWSYRLSFVHPATGKRMEFVQEPTAVYPWTVV